MNDGSRLAHASFEPGCALRLARIPGLRVRITPRLMREELLNDHHLRPRLALGDRFGGQPAFSSQDACEAYAAPLRQRVARTGAKRSETTVECIARIMPARRIAE